MKLAYEAFFLTQWVLFLLRRILSFGYGILQFVSKPGSRYIVPIGIAALLYQARPWLHAYFTGFIAGMRGEPDVVSWAQRTASRAYYGYEVDPWILDTIVFALFVIACGLYVLLSRALTVLLGAFPKMTRPLRPLRRLEPTAQNIRSAVVKIAVPKLPR